jgi:hypothetical protein
LEAKNSSPAQNPGEGIVLREANSITSTIRARSGALLASDTSGSDADMAMDAATQAQFQSEWQDIRPFAFYVLERTDEMPVLS